MIQATCRVPASDGHRDVVLSGTGLGKQVAAVNFAYQK